MITLEPDCPHCGQRMEDGGMLQDFTGPYSPYQDQELIQSLTGSREDDPCVHLYYCPDCRWDTRIAVSKVVL